MSSNFLYAFNSSTLRCCQPIHFDYEFASFLILFIIIAYSRILNRILKSSILCTCLHIICFPSHKYMKTTRRIISVGRYNIKNMSINTNVILYSYYYLPFALIFTIRVRSIYYNFLFIFFIHILPWPWLFKKFKFNQNSVSHIIYSNFNKTKAFNNSLCNEFM